LGFALRFESMSGRSPKSKGALLLRKGRAASSQQAAKPMRSSFGCGSAALCFSSERFPPILASTFNNRAFNRVRCKRLFMRPISLAASASIEQSKNQIDPAPRPNTYNTPKAIRIGEKPTCAVLQPYFVANTFSPSHLDTRWIGKARRTNSHHPKAALRRSNNKQKLAHNKNRPSFMSEILRPLYSAKSESPFFVHLELNPATVATTDRGVRCNSSVTSALS